MLTPRMSRAPSGASHVSSGSGRSNFDVYIYNAFRKIVHVVAEGRLLAPGVKERSRKSDFLLETRIVSEVDEELDEWTESSRGSPLVLTIAIDTNNETPIPPEGVAVSCRMESSSGSFGEMSPRIPGGAPRYQVLERWVLRHEQGAGQAVNPTSAVKQLLLLVRSVHSCLRLLPCHGTVAQLQCRHASMGLKYRLSTSLLPQPDEYHAGGTQTHEYSFGDVSTPAGRVQVVVQYRPAHPEDYCPVGGEVPLQDRHEQRERSVSCPTDPTDAASWLADAVAAVNATRTPRMYKKGAPDRPPLPHAPAGHREHSPRSMPGSASRYLRADTEPNLELAFPFEPLMSIPGSTSQDRDPYAAPGDLQSGTRPPSQFVQDRGFHPTPGADAYLGGAAGGGRPGEPQRISPHLQGQPSPRVQGGQPSPRVGSPRLQGQPSPRLSQAQLREPSPRLHGQPSPLGMARRSPKSNPLIGSPRMPEFMLSQPGSFVPGIPEQRHEPHDVWHRSASPAGVQVGRSSPDAWRQGSPRGGYGRFSPGTSPAGGVEAFFARDVASQLKASSSSPGHPELLLAGSVQALFADAPLGRSPQGMTWASEMRERGTRRESIEEEEEGAQARPPSFTHAADELDHECPFALPSDAEEPSNFPSLADIVRQCEQAPALSLLGEELSRSRGAMAEADEDSLLAHHSSTHVTVGDLIGEMEELQSLMESHALLPGSSPP